MKLKTYLAMYDVHIKKKTIGENKKYDALKLYISLCRKVVFRHNLTRNRFIFLKAIHKYTVFFSHTSQIYSLCTDPL